MSRGLFSFLVVLTTALMGSSFAIGKIGMNYSTPLLLNGYRFLIAGVLLGVIVILFKRPLPKQMSQWIQIVLIGFFQTTLVMGSIFISMRTITAGESSILTFMNPLFVVLFGTVFLRNRYKVSQWIGVIIGFVGVFFTLGGSLQVEVGIILGFIAAISWATATILIKIWGKSIDTWVLTAFQMLAGGILLLGASVLLEQPKFIVQPESIMILIWLSVMASIVQFSAWFFLLQKGDPGKTSAFLFLAPFFGVIFGILLLNEPLTYNVMFGGVFILLGIFLVNWSPSSANQKLELKG